MNVQGWIFTSYICMGSLFAITGVRQFFIEPFEPAWLNAAWFFVQVLPLLATLPSLMSGSVRGTFILSMAALLYFIHGTMVIFEPALRVLGIVEAVFALGLCAAASYVVRGLRNSAGSDSD